MSEERVHLAAIFPSWTDAEAALAEGREWGLDDEQLGLLVHAEGDHGLVIPAEHELLEAVGEGAVGGLAIGVAAGIAFVAVAIPGIGAAGAGGILAAGGGAAALGALLGSAAGAATAAGEVAEAKELESLPLGPGEVLVMVRPLDGDQVHLWEGPKGEMAWGTITEEITEIFGRHGGRMVQA